MFQFFQLFFIVVLHVFLLHGHFSGTLTSASNSYDCGNSYYKCPNGEYIEYPFYLDNLDSDYYCGYPGLSATCSEGGSPIITLSNYSYYYQHFGVGEIRVVDTDTSDQNCPQPRHNFSLDGDAASLLSIIGNVNATYLHNCTTLPKQVSLNLPCTDNNYNGTGRSFATYDIIPKEFNWYGNCQEKVTIPINYYPSEQDFTDIIKRGVVLRVKKKHICQSCEHTGGKCAYNRHSKMYSCSCGPGSMLFNGRCPLTSKGILRKLITGLLAGIGASLLILLLIYMRRYLKIKPNNMKVLLRSYETHVLQRYKYSEIKKMTNSFKDAIGQGGFGSVFKGKLVDDRMVAVKLLNESKGDGEEFINEVATIGRTNHVNVVNLIGFCTEGTKRALVYEFLVNGSLEKFIYKKKSLLTTYSPALGWEKLYQIALGIARGLEYLHRGCNNRILHFDIKPHNILLDSEFVPKISDFGLAKLSQTRDSVVSMVGARGTNGYIAPELYCRNFGVVSYKSDVYSYGMMLFEMIGGRKNIDATVENISEIYFPHWIYNHLNKETKIEVLEDTQIDVSEDILEDEIARKMIIVALWCIQAHPTDRPSMKMVAEMLEATNDKLQMPPNPSLHPSSSNSPLLS